MTTKRPKLRRGKVKQPKPKPKPCECWCIVVDGEIRPGWCGDRFKVREWKTYLRGAFPMPVIRVRIVPVVAKRRKGAK